MSFEWGHCDGTYAYGEVTEAPGRDPWILAPAGIVTEGHFGWLACAGGKRWSVRSPHTWFDELQDAMSHVERVVSSDFGGA